MYSISILFSRLFFSKSGLATIVMVYKSRTTLEKILAAVLSSTMKQVPFEYLS